MQLPIHTGAPDTDLVMCLLEVTVIRNASATIEPVAINPSPSLPAYNVAGLSVSNTTVGRAINSTAPITLCVLLQPGPSGSVCSASMMWVLLCVALSLPLLAPETDTANVSTQELVERGYRPTWLHEDRLT